MRVVNQGMLQAMKLAKTEKHQTITQEKAAHLRGRRQEGDKCFFGCFLLAEELGWPKCSHPLDTIFVPGWDFGKCLIVFYKERQHGAASINTDMEVGNVRQTRCSQNRYR